MALIKCPKCGGTVSTKALACPHCNAVPVERLLENPCLGKLADELPLMSEALSQLEQLPASSPQNILQVSKSGNPASASPPTELEQTQKQYSTGDIILYAVLWIAMAIFFVPASCMLINGYFKEPDTLGATPGSSGLTIDPVNWGLSGNKLPEGVTDSKNLPHPTPPAIRTGPNLYFLDKYMQVPNPKWRTKGPPPP